ncbi:uncharacterized protein TM35_002171000 [Trypanosoma theileri]|uniref:Uncharacterized protein n=1 Tax=Trypanosoma theileri TaxID=67003 RepID=A0A1X0NCY7_9TRYP|nr:uncharacterized protein TM35_002171000 [Trypanosoma theileri]ORC79241.1 hypothetical protein TM35_002171000 [Trypanosoma theileri]
MGNIRIYDYVSLTIIIICPQMSPTVQYTVAENNTATISSGAAVRIHTGLRLLSALPFLCTVEATLLLFSELGTDDEVVVGASVVVFSVLGGIVELVTCEADGAAAGGCWVRLESAGVLLSAVLPDAP